MEAILGHLAGEIVPTHKARVRTDGEKLRCWYHVENLSRNIPAEWCGVGRRRVRVRERLAAVYVQGRMIARLPCLRSLTV